MATVYSDEFTKVRAGRRLQANETQGKFRILKWDFASLPAGNIGDVLVCGIIHARERVVLGRLFFTAQGGTSTAAVGNYAIASDGLTLGAVIASGKYLAAASTVNASTVGLEMVDTTVALAMPEETADVFICITNAGSAFATAGRINGFLLIVGD
jgi:hypothetical protein